MKKTNFLLCGLIVLLSGVSSALAGNIPGLSREEGRLDLNRVQKQITLVESEKYGESHGTTTLRVGLVMLDNGGSTDVSPKATLYLSTFNESEEYEAGSLHKISHLNELISAERVAAGVYDVIVKRYANDFGSILKTKIRIDARDLTGDVREMKGAQEWEYQQITTPVNTEETVIE